MKSLIADGAETNSEGNAVITKEGKKGEENHGMIGKLLR